MKRLPLLILFVFPLLFLTYRLATRQKEGEFDLRYTNTVSQWTNKAFISLQPYDESRRLLLNRLDTNRSDLTSEQEESLADSIVTWWKAYSEGNRLSYLAFRLPEGAAWRWRDGSLEKMSNYFVNGTIFGTAYLQDEWIRRYGNPEIIPTFVPYSDFAKTLTTNELAEIRTRWVNKYGDGNASKSVRRPSDPLEQWLEIARDHSGGNWWSNYWTGVSLDEMVVKIVRYTAPPQPLYKVDFGYRHKRTGYDADASFPNMGIGNRDKRSYMEWQFTYADIIEKQGSVLAANIYAMFRRSEGYPQPALLRLVFLEPINRWVPMEFVDGHIMHGRKYVLYY
jgi:hypothetical protein